MFSSCNKNMTCAKVGVNKPISTDNMTFIHQSINF